jgi:metallo-beta-lactamase class B
MASAWSETLRKFTWRHVSVVLLVSAIVPVMFIFRAWNAAGDRGGQQPAEPFRIAGNFYYVGANDATSFLLTGPEGHVLIDGGYPGTAPMIIESIAKLGFNIKDVKVLLNSHAHHDHAGGLAALKQASGAQLWASKASTPVLASGGIDPDYPLLPWRALGWAGIGRYPGVRVDHGFADGDTIRVGSIVLTALITAGHTRGCTSWSFKVREAERDLNVVNVCSLKVMGGTRYPDQAADLDRSFRVLRDLPVDIWVTNHAREWGRYRKFVESTTAKYRVDPFIDPAGYRTYIDTAEKEFRAGRTY